MRQDLSNSIFTQKVISALQIFKREEEDIDGTIGVISLIKEFHAVFNYRPRVRSLQSSKFSRLRNSYKKLLMWKQFVQNAIKNRKIRKVEGVWTIKRCFI